MPSTSLVRLARSPYFPWPCRTERVCMSTRASLRRRQSCSQRLIGSPSAAGSERLSYTGLLLAAWRGDEAVATRLIETGVRIATARSEGRALGLAAYVTAVLHNGLGHYQKALEEARSACELDDLGFLGWALTEFVEAAVRSDDRQAATDALKQLEIRTSAAGTDWALGVLARSRALLSDGPAAEAHHREAIERLERSRITVHLARAHLLYGEWLRRENQTP